MVERWLERNTNPITDRESAIEYLLMSSLNLFARGGCGRASNGRLTRLLWDILQRLRPTIFCDIGAFDGNAAVAARQKLPDLQAYAFEANPEVFDLYATSPSLAGVKYLNLAISDSSGPVRIYAPRTLARYYANGQVLPGRKNEPKWTAKASLLQRDENATYTELDVAGVSLDDFFAEQGIKPNEHRFALWVDVEGAADKVLKGATDILAHTVAILIETEGFEFWKDQKDCAFLSREVIGRGFIPIARDREYGDHQFNILAVRADQVANIADELFNTRSALRSCMALSAEESIANRGPAISVGAHTSLGAYFQKSIPIIIPCFNLVTYLEFTISELCRRGFQNLVIVDNASTFPPMLDYLSQIAKELTVIRLSENLGPRSLFLDKKNFVSLPQYFCITDPDLEFNPLLPKDFLCELMALTEEHQVGKAGVALGLSDRELMRDDEFQIGSRRYRIWEWEAQFWEQQIGVTSSGDEIYSASVDTTLAVYNKRYFTPATYLKGVRVGGKYTCRHRPWYKDSGLPKEEEDFYRERERFSYYMKASEPHEERA